MKLPQGTDEEKDVREKAMEEGLKKAIQVKKFNSFLKYHYILHLLKVPDFFDMGDRLQRARYPQVRQPP